MIDPDRLRADWARLTEQPGGPDRFAATFYLYLFAAHPESRTLFPPGMTDQRDHLLSALAIVVAHADRIEAIRPELEDLGDTHRRFGVTPDGYDAVGQALGQALAHHGIGDLAPWVELYGQASGVMRDGAGRAHLAGTPAFLDLIPDPAETFESEDEVLHLVFDFPDHLPAAWQPTTGQRWQATALGAPGMWVELTVYETGATSGPDAEDGPTGWLSHRIDPTDPGSLALLYLPEDTFVRLGGPRPPAQEEPV